MTLQFIISLITLCFYGGASIAGITGMAIRNEKWISTGLWLGVGAFIFQTTALLGGYHKISGAGPTLGAYLQMPSWFSLLCGLVAWKFFHNRLFALFATPFAFVLFLISLPSVENQLNFPSYLSISFYILHLGTLLLSLGMLAIAFICSIIFLVLQGRLKQKKKLSGFWKDMPALTVLDKINGICAIVVFPLYTIGIIAGYFWANPFFGGSLRTDPKILMTLLVWALLAILFHNRLAKNWKGRKPALFIIAIFSLSLFSIFIINFFMPTGHNFL